MGMGKLSAVGGASGASAPVQTTPSSPTQTPLQSAPTQSAPTGIWPPAWGFRAGALDGQSKLGGPAWKAEWGAMANRFQAPAGTEGGDAVAFLRDRVQLDHPRRGLV